MKHLIYYIRNEFREHLLDYLLLITAGSLFIVAIKLLGDNHLSQLIALTAFVVFYIVWGIYHHVRTDHLRLKIMLEYILIGFVILFLFKLIILP